MEEFENRNTHILICINAAGMGVNIQNVARTTQWKIPDHLILVALLQ